ncbi:O-antigen ligase family protein [Janibacter hoylei]|uniref:O-antigen ligase family protein n=1 Tax=Janibacter hoylei TaxID=364298 RepID=UPI0022385DD9|nr:O-antigen ligase family protein [Janibacter hoylei]MCW4602535.1 O-antigen ligase family protein [Janibacter hoylei]
MAIVVMLFGSLLGPFAGAAVEVLAAGIVGIAVLRSLSVYGPVAWRTLLLAMLLIGVVAFRAWMEPPSTEYGQTKWVNFCTLAFVTMVAAVTVLERRAMKALALWWVVCGVALAGLALTDPASAGGRAQVDGSNPVWLARAISSSIVILVWLAVTKRWRWWRVLVLVPVLGAGLLATGSRGPAMAAVAGVVVLLIAPTQRRSKQIIGLVLGGVIFVVVAPLIPAVANSRFGEFISQGGVEGESRSVMWRSAIHLITGEPLGYGIGSWKEVSGSQFDYPHNLFLEVLLEQGWLVGGALILLVLGLGHRLWKRSGRDPRLQLALALVATETIHVSTSGDLNARTFFFVIILGAGLLYKQRSELAVD